VSGPRRRALLLALPALAFVAVLFVVPFLAVARVSVAGPGLPGSRQFFDLSVFLPSNLTTLAGDRLFLSVLGVTARLGLLVAAICMCVAVPYAAYVHRARGWRRWGLIGAVALPKLVNLLVLLYGVLLLLGRNGFLNRALDAAGLVDRPLALFGNLPAVVITEVLIVLPYPILVLAAAFCSTDPRLYEAARSLGAGPVRAYAETVVRPSAPAVAGAALISAVWGMGAFVGPLVMGNPPEYTVAVEVYTRALERVAWVDAAGWALLGVGALAALLVAVGQPVRLLARRAA
jgi:putative spermidine/putrescine transport system permease protein